MPKRTPLIIILIFGTTLLLFFTTQNAYSVNMPEAWQFRVPVIGEFVIDRVGGINTNGTNIYSGCTNHIGTVGAYFMDINRPFPDTSDNGAPIYAAASGKITQIQRLTTGFGKNIILKTDAGVYFRYAHLSVISVSLNQQVTQDTLIGMMGSTGNSTGNHLHWEAWVEDESANKVPYNGIYEINGIEENLTSPCSGINDGNINGQDVASNPWNWCPTVRSAGVSGAVLFDHQECKGNFLHITGIGIPTVGFEWLDYTGSHYNDRFRSIYIEPNKSLFVAASTYDISALNYCVTEDKWNLDIDSYEGSNTKIGWQGNSSTNMISWVILLEGSNCNAPGTQVQFAQWVNSNPDAVGGIIVSPEPDHPLLNTFAPSENPPLEYLIDVSVKAEAAPGDNLDAIQLCLGSYCQETSAASHQFVFNTYGIDSGFYDLVLRYRSTNDNGNWANAEIIKDTSIFLSPIRFGYAPCDQIADGAMLISGSECVGITQDIGDLMPVQWENRPDLQVCAVGNVSAWAYDGVLDNWGNFNGIPKVVDTGQCKNVGDNVSSIDLQEGGGVVGPLPDTPFVTEIDTIIYLRFDNNTTDETGNFNGNVAGSAYYVTGIFGSALNAPNPPDGSGVITGPFDLNAFTLDLWLARPVGSTGGRVACQLGGGGNTGQNKWCLHLNGNRPELEIWSGGGSQKLQSPYDLPDDGSWHYINVSYDGTGSAVMYVDNVYAGTLTTAGVMNAGVTTFEVGMGEGIYSCNCLIDEMRLRSGVHPPEIGSEIPLTTTSTPAATTTPEPTSTSSPTNTPVPTVTATEVQSGLPDISFTSQNYSVNEDAGSVTVEVVLSEPSENYIFPSIYTTNGTATWGDYTQTSSLKTLSPGQTSISFDIGITDDSEIEGNETFNVTLEDPDNAGLGNVNIAVITIIDNDPVSTPTATSTPVATSTVPPTAEVTSTPEPTPTPTEDSPPWQGPPNKPLLVSPTSGGTAGNLQATFDWSDASGATEYQLQVATLWLFSGPYLVEDISTIASDYTLTLDLEPNTRYYWRVRSANDAGFSSWTSDWEFVAPVPPPGLTFPTDGSIITDLTPTFAWLEHPDTYRSQIQISTSIDFSNLVLDDETWFDDYDLNQALEPGTTYYWRVRTRGFFSDFVDWWSPVWSFTTQ